MGMGTDCMGMNGKVLKCQSHFQVISTAYGQVVHTV